MSSYKELFYHDYRGKRLNTQAVANLDWRWWGFGASVGAGRNVYDLHVHIFLGPIDFEFTSWRS